MEDLSVTLVQTGIHWKNTDANLAMYEEKLWAAKPSTDLIVLPEMFNTGFTTDARKYAEPMNGKTFRWMKLIADQFKAVVTGSIIIHDQQRFYNRLIWMEPGGRHHFYDKRHLFSIAGEDRQFSSGSAAPPFTWKGWKIKPLVCYDLRFPVWSRNRGEKNSENLAYDLILFVANWPASRISVWDTLLRARAIENSAYCLGVNRVGSDGEGIDYNGHSCIYNSRGESLIEVTEEETIPTANLSYLALLEYRKKFPVHFDADDFEIKS